MIRLLIVFLASCWTLSGHAEETMLKVKITPSLGKVVVRHGNSVVAISRSQESTSKINPAYARTSRDCPPYCVQPITLAAGVETIGELEMLDYLKRITDGDDTVIVIDSRTPEWLKEGTIPGSINIPYSRLSPAAGADPFEIADLLETTFGAIEQEGLWNFSKARTLVLFCNGMWCGQSPTTVKTLLDFGYPADRIKWYRGGIQAWETLGLTVVR